MHKVFRSAEGKEAVHSFYNRILSTSPVRPDEIEIDTSFGRTAVLRSGSPDNPPLLLIHGTASNGSSWMAALPELEKRFCVYAPDIPGEPGKSEDSRFSCRGLSFSGWILDVLDALELKSVTLGGQSLGAWASLQFALHHPDRVGKLVLISPSGIAGPRVSYFVKMIFSLFRGEKGARKMISLLTNGRETDEGVYEFYQIMKQHCRYREDAPPLFSDEELKSLKVSFLYLAGQKDCLLNTEKSVNRLKSRTEGGTFRVYADMGYVVTDWTDDLIRFTGV